MTLPHLPPSLLALVLLRAISAGADNLPYNPTRILTTPDLSYAYIFELFSQGSNTPTLSTLDLTETISASQFGTFTTNSSIPFLPNGTSQGYTPFVEPSGNLTVVTGNCSTSAQKTEMWRYVPISTYGLAGGGSWTQIDVTVQDGDDVSGADYLANGAVFSPTVQGNEASDQFYLFGGMCPFANSSAQDWTRTATYSGSMLMLSATTAGEAFSLDTVSSMGGPIPEAGFSMTGLTPTYSTDQNGAPKTMQQDFLLIGGQTQTAFINMSSVAVYSLPQESWTFLPVQQPASVKTDLAVRQSNVIVEPRSGHTAVLSDDGERVYVVGGWVGDVSNPAMPQFAVLTLGSGYGGSGEGQTWSWSVPEQSGPGLAAGSGIYGHGATMLPGGVLMIVGGYSIPASSSKHRRAASVANQNLLLYNTSSNTWITSYTSPNSVSTSNDDSHSGGLTVPQQAGLGVGIGVGAALLIALIILYIWYSRRLKRVRREREARLTARSTVGSFRHYQAPFLDRGGIDGRGGEYSAMEGLTQERERVPSGSYSSAPEMEKAGSTGLFVDIPSPTRGLRKGLANRPYIYHAAPRYDDGRASRNSNHIHPIVEQEDEDEDAVQGRAAAIEGMSESERKLREVEKVLNSGAEQRPRDRHSVHTPSPTISNPFADPSSSPNPLGSHPVLLFDEDVVPGGTVRRVPTVVSRNPEGSPSRKPLLIDTDEASNWIAYQDAEDVAEHHDGRVSPAKTDDRTSSTLSDQSHASTTSITRTMSTRTGAILSATFAAWRAADNPEASPHEERPNPLNNFDDRRSQHPPSSRSRSRSNTLDMSYLTGIPQAGKSTDSFMTARTSFVQLQSEGEALLGGGHRDDPYQRALAAQSSSARPGAASSSRVTTPVPPPSRGKGWMGSLRRALTAMSGSERTNSMLTSSSTSHEDSGDSSSSPTRPSHHHPHHRHQGSGSGPRRTVSDGGALLLSQKRGKRDWDPARDEGNDWGEPRDDDYDDAHGAARPEEEWDVEGEANKRDVQVMFTVPKTRLRVVNADVERASMRSASDGAISRAGSQRSDTGAGGGGGGGRGSVMSLRGRGDGAGGSSALGITREEGENEREEALIPDLLAEGEGYKGKGKEKAA